MALEPQIMPSIPVISSKSALPVSRTAVSKKNKINKLPKTNFVALFFLSVPTNISNVNIPHMKKYAAIAVLPGAVTDGSNSVKLGNNSRMTKDHQNKPYEENATVPNVLPFFEFHCSSDYLS